MPVALFTAAAAIPARAVPWPLGSLLGSVPISLMPAAMRPARSGCDASTPVSRTAIFAVNVAVGWAVAVAVGAAVLVAVSVGVDVSVGVAISVGVDVPVDVAVGTVCAEAEVVCSAKLLSGRMTMKNNNRTLISRRY